MKLITVISLSALLGTTLAFDREALAGWYTGLNPDKVILAISSGSNEAVEDLAGFTYSADRYFVGGNADESGDQMQWALPNSEVYHSERWGTFKYQLPMPTNSEGQYTLILKFSEIYFQEPGQKLFDIKIGSSNVIRNLDIFEKLTSRGIPYDEFIDIKVKGSKVWANGIETKDGLVKGSLVVEFAKGGADNPKVNALVLVEGGKENTHFDSHKKYLKALADLKKEQMR